MLKMRLITLITGIFFFNTVLAQDTLNLNFEEAVNIALKNNVSIRQEKNNLEIALANRRQSRALFTPGLRANVNAYRYNGQQFDQITGESFFDNTDNASMNLTAYYTLFNGLNRLNTNKRSESMLEAQQYNLNSTEQLTIYTVASDFLQVLLDDELLRISEQNLDVQKSTLQQISGFVEAGTRPLSDRLDQEATVSSIEVEMIRARNKLRMDMAQLKQTLLLDPETALNPKEPEWSFESILVSQYDLNQLFKTAITHRPDYKKILADKEASDAAINIAKSGYYPTLDLVGQISSSYTSRLEDVGFSSQFGNNRQFLYGLQLTIPIYQQYSTNTQKIRAKMEYENAKLAEENQRLMIFRDVQNAYLDFLASKDEYYAAEKQYDAAEQAYKIQNERYNLGVGDFVELSRSTGTFVEAAASRAQARYTLLFQKIMLEYATGTLTKEEI